MQHHRLQGPRLAPWLCSLQRQHRMVLYMALYMVLCMVPTMMVVVGATLHYCSIMEVVVVVMMMRVPLWADLAHRFQRPLCNPACIVTPNNPNITSILLSRYTCYSNSSTINTVVPFLPLPLMLLLLLLLLLFPVVAAPTCPIERRHLYPHWRPSHRRHHHHLILLSPPCLPCSLVRSST